MEHSVTKLEADKLEVVPPDELKQDPVGGLVGHLRPLVLLDLVVDHPGRKAAVCQPGTELGRIVLTNKAISGLLVSCHGMASPKVVLESRQARALSASEGEGSPMISADLVDPKILQTGKVAGLKARWQGLQLRWHLDNWSHPGSRLNLLKSDGIENYRFQTHSLTPF